MATAAAQAAPLATIEPAPHLDDLFRPDALQAANPHVFPSVASLLWFERVNRAELLAAGALVELAGRKMYRGSVFVAKALEIGARRAAARVKAPAAP